MKAGFDSGVSIGSGLAPNNFTQNANAIKVSKTQVGGPNRNNDLSLLSPAQRRKSKLSVVEQESLALAN